MSYDNRDVVGGIDLDVRRGEVFALVGPAGAGKTTTVEMLEGCRRRTGGDVSVLGVDPQLAGPDWRARVGVVVPPTGHPELVLLDEPTAGLDRVSRRLVWNALADARARGVTVLLATASMEEAAAVADRIAILAAGKVAATGTPRTLVAHSRSEISFVLPSAARVSDLPEPARVGAHVDGARRVTVRSTAPMVVLGALAPWAEEHGWSLRDIEVRRPNLEDFYREVIAGR
jgi:ABC-2 type transport system ATP-binding protein